MTITISEMMSKSLETIQENGFCSRAAKKMKEKDISSLVVVDNQDKLQGIVIEHDIVRRHALMIQVLVQ